MLGAVAHKSSTPLCTDSGDAVLSPYGRQQRSARRCVRARPARRTRGSGLGQDGIGQQGRHRCSPPLRQLVAGQRRPTQGTAGIPADARRAGAGKKTSCRGRIRQGPPMYEMEGPCPASLRRLTGCPASLAPRAARRCQVPVRRTGFPAPPTFPGWPPGWYPFPTVKAFLLPPPAQAQGVATN